MAGLVGGGDGGNVGAGWSATLVRKASMVLCRCRADRGGAGGAVGVEVWDVVWCLMYTRSTLLYLVFGIFRIGFASFENRNFTETEIMKYHSLIGTMNNE